MANFDNPSRLREAAEDPTAPKGLQQMAGRAATGRERFLAGESKLAPWAPKDSLLEQANQWYGGTNTEGAGNGWNTDFYREMFNQYGQWEQRAQTEGNQRFYDWLNPQKNPTATGVVAWGADPTTTTPDYEGDRFGDVYFNGRKVSNVYESYDRETADVMMGEYLFSNDEKERLFDKTGRVNDPNRYKELRDKVEGYRQYNEEQKKWGVSAQSFQDEYTKREEDLHRNGAPLALAGAAGVAGGATTLGAIATAAAASGAAFSWTGPGALLAAGGAALATGFAAWLNRDQLTEMTAQAIEVVDRSNGAYAKAASALEGTGQVGGKLISPLSNTVQGIYDAQSEGGSGDMTAAFQEMRDGHRTAPSWVQGLDLAASLGDGVLQFASPVGQYMYMGTMGAQVTGGVMGLSTGEGFNLARGSMDQYEGWKEWSAAIGSTTIDAAQLGIAGAVSSAARSARIGAGQAPIAGTSEATTNFLQKQGDRATDLFRKDKTKADEVTSFETVNGVRYGLDKEGTAVTRRATVELLAPSEFLRYIPNRWHARTMKASDEGAIIADDVFRAAKDLSMPDSKLQGMLLLGWSEGSEEGIQAILDPASFSQQVDPASVFQAAAYGFAGGAGMSLGASLTRPSFAQVQENQARFNHVISNNGQMLDDDQWRTYYGTLTERQKADLAKPSPAQKLQIDATLQSLTELQQMDATQTAFGLAALQGMKIAQRWEKLYNKALKEGNGSLVLMGMPADTIVTPGSTKETWRFPPNAAVMTAFEAVNQIRLINKGLAEQRNFFEASILENEQIRASAQDPDVVATAEKAITAATERMQDLAAQRQASDRVVARLESAYAQFVEETGYDEQVRILESMNELIRLAYNGELRDGNDNLYPPDIQSMSARAVEFNLVRHPEIDSGSFAMFMPQISLELTKAGAHSTVYMHQATLKTLGADHDGDTGVPQHDIYRDAAQRLERRRGTQYVREMSKEEKLKAQKLDPRIDVEATRYTMQADPPDAEVAYIRTMSAAMDQKDGDQRRAVYAGVNTLVQAIYDRYASNGVGKGPFDGAAMNRILQEFEANVKAGNENARVLLVEALWNLTPTAATELHIMSDATKIPEFLWLSGQINMTWDSIQREFGHLYALNREEVQEVDPARQPADNAYQTGIAKLDAKSAASNLTLLGQVDATRAKQSLHYSAFFQSSTELGRLAETGWTEELRDGLIQKYAVLATGDDRSDLEKIQGKNAVEDRVRYWIDKIAKQVDSTLTTPELRLLLANVSVPDIQTTDANQYRVVDGKITLLQLLLRKSVEIERVAQRTAPADSDIMRKLNTIEGLTYAKGDHSSTAAQAVVEVYGSHQFYDLLGDSSMYLGPQVTVDQWVQILSGMDSEKRQRAVNRLKRSPAYFKHHGTGDAPWSADVLESGEINAFTMLVDAMAMTARTSFKRLESRDETVHRQVISGLNGLHAWMDTWRQSNAVEFQKKGVTTDKQVLRDLLEKRPELASLVVDILPTSAHLGVFKVEGKKVYTAKWLEEMLVERDVEKAAKMLFLHTKLAQFNVAGGTIDWEKAKKGEATDRATGKVRYSRLDSRFLQVLHELASDADGVRLAAFLKMADEAADLEALFKGLNEEPLWRGDREKLLPYHDEVSLFEVDPKNVWIAGGEAALQRENLRGWGDRLSLYGARAKAEYTAHKSNTDLIANMVAYAKSRQGTGAVVDVAGAKEWYGLLKLAIENRQRFPDAIGQAAREQMIELLQVGFARMHDKGKVDESARAMGEPYITMDSWGYKNGILQEADALTVHDWDDVKTNLTKLVYGPTRIQQRDGSIIEIDMSKVDNVLEMLADPRTQAFAIAVIFPTVRDINTANVVQAYQDVNDTGLISEMLLEQNFPHLFNEEHSRAAEVAQAYRYIGTIEAYVRRAALDQPVEDQAAMYMPIQNMINDFILAYSHSPRAGKQDPEKVRQQLVVDVANAIKAMSALEKAEQDTVRRRIKAVMLERLAGDDSLLKQFSSGGEEQQVVSAVLMSKANEQYTNEMTDLAAQEAAAIGSGNTAEAARIAARKSELDELMKRIEGGDITAIPSSDFVDVESVLNDWTLVGADPVDIPRKASILRYLGRKHRLNRIENKDTADLVSAVRAAIFQDPAQINNPELVSPEDWNTLGSWAATLFISELGSRSSSEVGMAPIILGADGDQIRRYYDKTWSYLADGLFDANVLAAANILKQQANYAVDETEASVMSTLEDGLFNTDRMGEWTDRIPLLSLEARQILLRAPVGAAIQTEGNDPKELGELIGAGWVTWKEPDPAQHVSNYTLAVAKGTRIADSIPDPRDLVKLQNHFISRIEYTYTDEQGVLQTKNLLDVVGRVNSTHADIAASPYRVLDLTLLDKWLNEQRTNFPDIAGAFEIDYVDISKMPSGREWANNIYFEGVGREAAAGTSGSPIAAMFFALGGLSKIGQQNPLDQATKKGKQFRAFITSKLSQTKQFEAPGATIEQQLMDKALHMWGREYPGGYLLRTDLPALYKLMRMRHIVVGYDANGEKQVWWPEQAIEAQTNGVATPLDNMQLIPLTDTIANTLHGGGGWFGLKDVATRPVLNISDLSTYPPLTPQILEELGLTGLGEAGSTQNSGLTQVSSLPKATFAKAKAGPLRTRWQHRSEKWRGQEKTVHFTRSQKRGTGKGKYDIDLNNRVNGAQVIEALSVEGQGAAFQKMGVQHSAMQNLAALEVSQGIVASIDKYMDGPNSVLWVHDQEAGTSLERGILGVAKGTSPFERDLSVGPVFGDAVAIKLDSILRAAGNKQDAYEVVLDVLREYTDRGLVIVLISNSGDQSFRKAVTDFMRAGSMDYEAVNGSGHVFTPILEDPTTNSTALALHSTLTETRVFSTDGIELALLADEDSDTGLSEGVQYVDVQHARNWRRVVAAIIPSSITGSSSSKTNQDLYAFNVPAKGTDGTNQYEIMKSKLLPLLRSPEGRAWLAQLAGGENGDPAGFNKYRKNPNGTIEPGILSLEDALTKLQDQLEGGHYPTDEQQVLHTGSIIPLITGHDTILLTRVGFDLPGMKDLGDMLRTPEGEKEYVAGGPLGARVAISMASISAQQSVPPPFTVDEVTTDHRGIRIIGKYEQGVLAKEISEGTGLKEGLAPLPKALRFLKQAMAPNGTRVTKLKSRKGVISKEAGYGTVDNFRWAFATYGIDFREDLNEFFWGAAGDPKNEAEFKTRWNNTRMILDIWARKEHGLSAYDIERGLDANSIAIVAQNGINSIMSMLDPSYNPIDLQQDPSQPVDPKRQLVLTILAALAAPGVEVDHVVSTSGVLGVQNRASDAQVRLMPALFTDALDDLQYPEMRSMIFERLNSQMPVNPDTNRPIYYLNKDWSFEVEMWDDRVNKGNGGYVRKKGNLQLTFPVPADENSVQLAQASLKSKTQISPHIARVTNVAGGGIQTTEVKFDKDGNIVGLDQSKLDELWANDIMRFESGTGETVWDMLRRVATEDAPYNPWERVLPMQRTHLRKADQKVRQYITPVDKSDPVVWDSLARVNAKQDELLTVLGLTDNMVNGRFEVDYLVRQFLGRPGRADDQEVYVEEISQSAYLQAVELMLENVGPKKRLHPLHGGVVSFEHHDFWRMVYDANLRKPPHQRWAPVSHLRANGAKEVAKDWNSWVAALIDQHMESNTEFHAMFRTDLDGFWHTYQGTIPSLLTQQMSMDDMVNLKLMDPETNRFYLSLDPQERALMSDPIILNNQSLTYDAIMGNPTTIAGLDARTTETSDLAQQIERQKNWLAGQGMAPQEQVNARQYARNGVKYLETQRKTTNFMRGLVNLSITMRLANPALYVSALFEVPMRNALEHSANLMTGTYTGIGAGTVGRALSPTVKPRFTPAELEQLDAVADSLGQSNLWLGELFKEMTYQSVVQVGGQGRVSKFLEGTASKTAMMTSDPRWGQKYNSAAKRYIEGAWEYLVMTGNQITVEQFAALMARDPLWLMKNSPKGRFSAHQAGVNRVAQVRSTKQTSMGKAIMKPVDSLTASGSAGANILGHLIKIPFLFTRFNINAFMTITGLNAFDQAAAMLLDQQPNTLGARIRSFSQVGKYDKRDAKTMDLSEVIEGVDLSRAFAKGALTQTGLMIAGFMAGGLGLGGEDEEERKRRLMAQYLNIPYYRDPRQAQNDFRWTDAIFLDSIPYLDTFFMTDVVTEDENGKTVTAPGHSAVVPHWILKQFISPVLGIGRFFETGDAREIGYGFIDAFSVIPQSALNLWGEADMTAKLLTDAAKDTEGVDAAEVEQQTSQLMINVVSIYEKALLESSFVNSMRSAFDKYDRNPWILPKTADENTGQLDRTQGQNLPQQTNAMRPTLTPEGEVISPYAVRTGDDALRHQYAENNFTAAVLMSLFTGQFTDSSFMRDNMAVKERTVYTEGATKAEAEALFHSAFMAPGHQVFMTKDEIIRKLKERDEQANVRWDQKSIEAQADEIWERENGKEYSLSILDAEGREVITKEGGRAIYSGVKSGLLQFGDAALQGLAISQEMRDEIATEWYQEIIQEGVDNGLPEATAKYRANRIWWGDQENPAAPGLREIIYSNKIPVKAEATYQQLNTTYVVGPDGRPWATPFQRQSVMQSLGIPTASRMTEIIPGVTGRDERGNTVDLVRGINTGMASLEPMLKEPELVPNDKAIEEANAKTYTTSQTPYGRRGYSYGGRTNYGGGSYSSFGPRFEKMWNLPSGTSARADGIPMINTSNPILRRSNVRRERISSERGRLKQWQ